MLVEGQNTEQRILKAAEIEFLAKGYDGARTSTIAKAAGVTHAMLHYYFRTKEKLFERVFVEKKELMKTALQMQFSADNDLPLEEKLRAAIKAHFEFLKSNPGLPRFIVTEVFAKLDQYDYLHKYIKELARGVCADLQQCLDKAVAQGEAEPIEAMTLLTDMIFLNIFAFIDAPMYAVLYGEEDMGKILEDHMRENMELITRRIKKR